MKFVIDQKGQSLVEALVALAAAVVIVSAIAVAVITSVNNSDFSKNQNLATQYAQEGIEILRNLSQSDWAIFSTYSGTYCLNQNSATLTTPSGATCTQNINSFFVRQAVINQGSSSCSSNTKVSVSVAWADGKCTSASNPYCHAVLLDSCLANINSTTLP
jgi:Tfp pilus assembly protein PilV